MIMVLTIGHVVSSCVLLGPVAQHQQKAREEREAVDAVMQSLTGQLGRRVQSTQVRCSLHVPSVPGSYQCTLSYVAT